MDGLMKCSKILYDYNISKKIQEINILKRRLNRYETPSVPYSNVGEWEDAQKTVFKIMKDRIASFFDEERDYILPELIVPDVTFKLYPCIENALFTLTNNREWSERVAYDIADGIGVFWEILSKDACYRTIDFSRLQNMIYNNIIQRLVCRSPAILEDVPVFICKICIQFDNCMDDDNKCFNEECIINRLESEQKSNV